METWVWLAAYLVGFLLLQLYLYRYFMNESTTTRSAERATPVSEGATSAVDPPENVPDSDLVTCRVCGANNENHQMFSFCRECGSRLE